MLSAVDQAWAAAAFLETDHPLRVRVAWKRAKAHADFGEASALVACIEPVLNEALFTDPSGVRGAAALARSHQDALGYGNPTIRGLWTRLASHHRSDDRYRWATAMLELGWDAACRGDQPVVEHTLGTVSTLTPNDLVGSLSRHPEASDGPESAHWLHLDAAHTSLRAAVWAGERARAVSALGSCAHALEELALPSPPPSIFEAQQECHLHFGTPAPPGFLESLDGLSGFHLEFGRALYLRAGFSDVAPEGRRLGPEWELATRLAAIAVGEAAPDSLTDLARSTGCHAFLRAAPDRPSNTHA